MPWSIRKWPGVAVSVCVMMAVVACGGGGTGKHAGPSTTLEQPARGGTLVVQLPAEPSCADWLAPCGTFLAGFLAMARPTAPRPLDVVGGVYRPTPLLSGEPVLETGPPQRVTYRLNPKAVWSDGAPITSSDFRYTWDQVANGVGIANRTGFDKIGGVDDADPRTAVVTFKEPYAAWRILFPTILPKHLLDGKDRGVELKDGYSWSGGPWLIDHWTRGQEIRLVPNSRYWDKVPNLDAVVWKIIPDTAAAVGAYKTGQVTVLMSAPPEVTAADLRSLPDTVVDVAVTFGINYVNFNTQKAPLDSLAVRQALAYAADRDAVAAQALGPLKPDVKSIQSWMTSAYGRWYVDSYAKYRRDLTKVDQLMRADGWAKGSDGTWAKGGQRAEFGLLVTAGSRASELAAQVIQSQWKDAGFEVTVTGTTLNARTDAEAKGNYQASLGGFAFSNTGDDPGRCLFFCSANIPTAANGFSGMDVTRIASPAVDDAWDRVNTELDDTKRLDAVKRANDLTADQVPGLPYAPSLSLLVYNSAKLAGPVTNNVPSAFYNLNEWWCRAGRC